MLFLFLSLLLTPATLADDVVSTLAADPNAATLVQLVTTANLGSALSSGGPFTIFAPTNDAFTQAGTVDPSQLADILKYHVVSGIYNSSSIVDDMQVTTLGGEKIRLNVYTQVNTITANGAKVVSADKMADNGVIHFIDHVITPRTKSIVEIVATDPELSTLLQAVGAAGIGHEFQGDNMTLFAPTNAAFTHLPKSDFDKLVANPDQLKTLLEYHVLPHTLYSAGVYHHEYEKSIDGAQDRVHIRKDPSRGVVINDATVTTADIQAKNGVIHKIDHVLIPVRVGFFLRTGKVGK